MTRVFSPTRHGIPLLAIAMVSFAGWSIAAKHDPRVATAPPIAAPRVRLIGFDQLFAKTDVAGTSIAAANAIA